MYCRYCGKKLKDDAVICAGCRRPVEAVAADSSAASVSGPSWSLATMVTLIVGTLLLPPVGLIFGLIGLRSESKKVQGAVLLTVSAFMMLLMTAVILGL